MDLVIFTGTVPDGELKHERAAEYERLASAGALSALATAPPSAPLMRRGYIVGTIGLTLGLGLFALIVYAVMR
jgi:hypothetical protein